VLGDAATDDIVTAWGEAYWLLADVLSAREAGLYRELAAAPGAGPRALEVHDVAQHDLAVLRRRRLCSAQHGTCSPRGDAMRGQPAVVADRSGRLDFSRGLIPLRRCASIGDQSSGPAVSAVLEYLLRSCCRTIKPNVSSVKVASCPRDQSFQLLTFSS
jgi:hypothetical protein